MVIGGLAIVFACIGLLVTLAVNLGFPEEAEQHWESLELGFFETWTGIYFIAALILACLHLTAGIASIIYHRFGPALITAYGAAAIVLAVTDIGVSVSSFPGNVFDQSFNELVGPRIALNVCAFPWPIVATVLMNLRVVRRACTENLATGCRE